MVYTISDAQNDFWCAQQLMMYTISGSYHVSVFVSPALTFIVLPALIGLHEEGGSLSLLTKAHSNGCSRECTC